MPDILQEFVIKAPRDEVFQAVSRPTGLDSWWTGMSTGEPQEGADYELSFGPGYEWRARVTRCVPDTEFELEMMSADEDWLGTRVGFRLSGEPGRTLVRFHHTGWPAQNEHYRVSCHCWALYLRLLRRHLEHGELVPYEERLDA